MINLLIVAVNKIFPDLDPKEYVFMVGGSDGESGGMPEIFNLGCPTFQCNKIDEVPGRGAIANILNSIGAVIGDTPILCGGNNPEETATIYDKCFKFIKNTEPVPGGGHAVVQQDRR